MLERKVTSAAYAAAVTTIAMHLLNFIPAVAAMPDGVKASLATLVTAAATFAVGYLAEHTPRPDLDHEPRHAADGDT